MSKLYIIGNGFDLFHGLPTSYSDFNAYALDNNFDFEQHFQFKTNHDSLWQDFEADLGTFDSDNFFDMYNEVDIQRENFKYSEIYGLEDELEQESTGIAEDIKNSFFEWLSSIDFATEPKVTTFTADDFFLSFNYSPLLQRTYLIESSNIIHIHGSVEEGFIELGHGNEVIEQPTFDEDGQPLAHPLSTAEGHAAIAFSMLQKPVQDIIKRQNNFFENMSQFSHIFILGHSLSDVDLPYFRLIAESTTDAHWQISIFNEEDEDLFTERMQSIGVNANRISFLRIEHLTNYS